MRRGLLVPAAGLLIAAAAVGSVWWMVSRGDDNEEGWYLRGESMVEVANPGGAVCSLFLTGDEMGSLVPLTLPPDGPFWLGPGRYMLRAEQPGGTLWFPIALTGYRCGPEDGGSFRVTVRTFPEKIPPGPGEFLYVPAGTFLLGDRRNPREPHYVWLPAFFVAVFEVTNEEFRRFLSDPNGYGARKHWTEEGWAWHSTGRTGVTAAFVPGTAGHRRFGRPDQPVVWVNWFEAEAYCSWLTERHGGGKWLFALPTEAEWEKVARGPEGFDYALGMHVSDRESPLYNWRRNPLSDTTLVGIALSKERYRPNRYGAYHLTGNALEWTRSLFLAYNKDSTFDTGARNLVSASGRRVARGGSWYSASNAYLLNSYRDAFQPEHSSQELGFRIVAKLLP